MADTFEIPEAARDMAERTVEQARVAYTQFVEAAQRAQEMMTRSSGAMTQSAIEIQAKTMRYAQQNMESGFELAMELARARDMKEYFEIQTRHAQRQIQRYTAQSQELAQMMTEAARKAQPRG
jgi:phasin